MQLSKNNASTSCDYRVLIGNEISLIDSISSDDQSLLENFLKLDKDSADVKSLDSSILLVKSNKNKEKMRKAGAAFRTSLDKDVKKIGVNGSEEDLYPFIEGFMLASYQFIKYFKDRAKKAFKLTDIYVGSNILDNSIT